MPSPTRAEDNQGRYDRILVVWNQSAGNSSQAAGVRAALDHLEQMVDDIEHGEPGSAQEAIEMAADASGRTLVLAAGGDGTVHAVAQGLIKAVRRGPALKGASHRPGPVLGVIPLGTANDLARSLGFPIDPARAVGLLPEAEVRLLDAARLEVDGDTQWMINAAAGGNAAEVSRRINSEQKRRWGPWCYVRGVAEVLSDLASYRLELVIDDEASVALDAFNILVAQGRTVATMEAAPRADLEDGRLDLIIVREAPPLEIARTAAEFFAGDYLENDSVVYRQASRVEIHSERRIGFSIDGEVHSGHTFRFSVHPSTLPAAVGPGYRQPMPRSPEDE